MIGLWMGDEFEKIPKGNGSSLIELLSKYLYGEANENYEATQPK
jgi:hypothetical protein